MNIARSEVTRSEAAQNNTAPANIAQATTGARHHKAGITRRRFIQGAALAGGALAAISVLPGCTHTADEADNTTPTTIDADDGTSVTSDYTYTDLSLTEQFTWSLSAGSVLRPAQGSWMPLIAPGETASTMVVAQALSLLTGSVVDVVSELIHTGTNWVIYDVCCSDSVYAWIELDTLERSWALYAQPFSAGTLSGNPTLLWEADSEYDPPHMCCTGSSVIWQVMPSLSGSSTTESSVCYLWKTGSSEAQAVVESSGRFATAPTVSGDVVVLAPRVNADQGVYYGITAYSLDDDLATIVDRLTLPVSIAPFKATRIGDEFVFSVEANYSSGGLFANMGTFIGHDSGPFVWLSREPLADVAGSTNGIYFVKSTSSYFVINTQEESYSILTATNNSLDFGEYPASCGETTQFVTFATVKDDSTGSPQEVCVRTFAL